MFTINSIYAHSVCFRLPAAIENLKIVGQKCIHLQLMGVVFVQNHIHSHAKGCRFIQKWPHLIAKSIGFLYDWPPLTAKGIEILKNCPNLTAKGCIFTQNCPPESAKSIGFIQNYPYLHLLRALITTVFGLFLSISGLLLNTNFSGAIITNTNLPGILPKWNTPGTKK